MELSRNRPELAELAWQLAGHIGRQNQPQVQFPNFC